MYKIFTDILSQEHLATLKEIARFEVKYFLCENVPKYQSYNFMHKKYEHVEAMQAITNFAKSAFYSVFNEHTAIDTCWFNILKEDSNFGWHTHPTHTVVFYLENLKQDGTVFEDHELPGAENSALIVEPNILHQVPQWNNNDRITIAMELSK